MKNSIDKKNRNVKNVFCDTTIFQQQYSEYPLGEDFYNIHTDDKELKNLELFTIKDSKI